MQTSYRVGEEGCDRLLHRLRMHAGVANDREVAVTREAHVVELDLVETCLRCGYRNVDVVFPGGSRIRVEPRETAVRTPERAVAFVNRELRVRDRRDRILEGDDTADQVDACPVRLRRGGFRVVVPASCAVLDGERGCALDERDVAVLVLHVDLDRVQAVALEREVLWNFPGRLMSGPVTW